MTDAKGAAGLLYSPWNLSPAAIVAAGSGTAPVPTPTPAPTPPPPPPPPACLLCGLFG